MCPRGNHDEGHKYFAIEKRLKFSLTARYYCARVASGGSVSGCHTGAGNMDARPFTLNILSASPCYISRHWAKAVVSFL